MGNCMSPIGTQWKQHEGDDDRDMQQLQFEKKAEFVKENSNNGVRVKIVLRKEELEWLMLQLKGNNGGKKIEDFLGEIERWRSGKGRSNINEAWKPCLESIMECPEMEIR